MGDALIQFARFTPEDLQALARAEAVFRSLDPSAAPARGRPPPASRRQGRPAPSGPRSGTTPWSGGSPSATSPTSTWPGGEGTEYVLKVSRIPEADSPLDAEREAVAEFLGAAGDTHYRNFVPTLVESFPVRDPSRSGSTSSSTSRASTPWSRSTTGTPPSTAGTWAGSSTAC